MMSITPKLPKHPQSAQVRKSESKIIKSRPLTGIPPNTFSSIIPITSPTHKGSIYNLSSTSTSRLNLQTCISTNN